MAESGCREQGSADKAEPVLKHSEGHTHVVKMLLALVALGQVCFASAQDAKAIDEIVSGAMAKNHTPGLSLAVVRDGKVAYENGYGFADIENKVPATPETVYEIGSVTKQFTAAMVLQLLGEGKLKLDESIRAYLPDLPEAWKPVTVWNLLTHTSGIKAYTDVPKFYSEMREPAGDHGFLDLVGKLPFDFEPGTDWKYDNSGYFILGLVIEKLTGKSFAENLQERISKPLGMRQTMVNDWEEIVPHRARGYQAGPRDVPENTGYVDLSWPFAAGAMISTVGDLAKWDAALYTDKPVKQSLWKLAWTPAKLANGREEPYGFGWALGQMNGVPYIDHAGAINGFNAEIIRVPSKKLTVIVMCNAFPGIAVQVARAVIMTLDPSLKQVYKAVSDPDPKRTALHEDLLAAFAGGNAKEGLFTDDMKSRLFPGFANQLYRDLKDLGKIESFVLIRLTNSGGFERREYHAVMGGQGLDLVVVTDSGGKIAGFSLVLT